MNKLLYAVAALCLIATPGLAFAQSAVAYQDDTVAPILNIPVTTSKPLPVTGTINATTSATAVSLCSNAVAPGASKPLAVDLFSALCVINVDPTSHQPIDPNAALPAGANTIGTVNLGTINGIALDASVTETHGTKAPGSAAAKSELWGCIFETVLPTLVTTNQAAAHCDSSARLFTSDTQAQTKLDTLNTSINAATPAGSNLIGHVDGPAAALATTSGNPNKVGCVFQTNTTAATTGQNQNVACDAFGNTGKSLTPSMATQITAQSATTANTANTATLAAAASKLTYISGFACTSGGATAAQLATVTVAGLITGSMTYTVAIPAGVTGAMTPLIVSFPNPIQGSAANTAITVQIGAAGAGNTAEQCNAQGFQQ